MTIPTMRTWHLIWSMHFPPNDWSRRNENICQLREKIFVKTRKNICVRQLVPCTLSPRSGRRDGPPHLAGALRLRPACSDSWQWVGARVAGRGPLAYVPATTRRTSLGYPAHSDTDGRHTQLFQVCFNHVIFQSLNSFGFFAYEYTSWWIYFNRNDKTLPLSSIRFYENWTKKWPPWGYKNVFSKCACVCLKLLQCPAKGRRLSGWWNEN